MIVYSLTAVEATLYGAILVAALSVAKLLYDRLHEGRAEFRALLRPYLLEYAEAIYGVLACCAVLAKTANPEQRGHWVEKSRKEAEKLALLRPKLRYALWGLDEGFRVLIRLPGWTCHAVSDSRRAAELIDKATRLRITMDRVALRCFRSGRPPGWISRLQVAFHVRRCREVFNDQCP